MVVKMECQAAAGSRPTMKCRNMFSHNNTTIPTTLEFSEEVTIKSLVLYFIVHSTSGYSYTCDIQTSTDGTNWTTIETTPTISAATTYTVTTPITTKYIRFKGAGGQAPLYCHVNGLDIEY